MTVYDRDSVDSGDAAAWVAAGMIAAATESVMGEPQPADSARHSIRLWQQWLPLLCSQTEEQLLWQLSGSIIVAHQRDRGDMELLQRRFQSRLGPPGAHWQILTAEQLAELEPQLGGHYRNAIRVGGEGFVDNRQLMRLLAKMILLQGGCWHERTEVESIKPGLVRHSKAEHRFDWVADCRGCGARQSLPGLRAVRGEIIRLRAPEVQLNHPLRLVHPRYPLYVVPRPQHQYVVGATELECDSSDRVTVRSALELLSAAFSLHSGFAEAEVVELGIGHRPAFADNLPRLHIEPGLIAINGLYRNGFSLAPALVQNAVDAVRVRSDQSLGRRLRVS